MKNTLFALVAVSIFSTLPAHAFELAAVGGLDQETPKASGVAYEGQSFKGDWAPLYGGLLGFRITPRVNFETGFLYVTHKFDDTVLGIPVTVSAAEYEIPLLLRLRLMRFLSIGVGGYVSRGTNKVDVTVSGTTTTEAAADHSTTMNDYGLLGSVQLRLPLIRRSFLLGDVRYQYGLSNRNTDPTQGTFNSRDLQVLFGLGFYL